MSYKVLVVDDSAVIRSVVRMYLEDPAYELVEASSGDRALHVMRLVAIDLIIADINMPGLDGLALLDKLRTDDRPSTRRVPVVLMTADRSPGLEAKAKERGASAFLSKPVGQAGLQQVVKELLPVP